MVASLRLVELLVLTDKTKWSDTFDGAPTIIFELRKSVVDELVLV